MNLRTSKWLLLFWVYASVMVSGQPVPESARAVAESMTQVAGSADDEDKKLVVAELAKVPLELLQKAKALGVRVNVVRNNVTESLPHLKGVQVPGWPKGLTWDRCPGNGGFPDCVVAVRGHNSPEGRYLPSVFSGKNPGTNSINVTMHEFLHSVDLGDGNKRNGSGSAAFRKAFEADRKQLRAYEQDPVEAYAESGTRFFAGDPESARKTPQLHAYWKKRFPKFQPPGFKEGEAEKMYLQIYDKKPSRLSEHEYEDPAQAQEDAELLKHFAQNVGIRKVKGGTRYMIYGTTWRMKMVGEQDLDKLFKAEADYRKDGYQVQVTSTPNWAMWIVENGGATKPSELRLKKYLPPDKEAEEG